MFIVVPVFFCRFAVNLTLGHTHNDIALHINPRLPQNYIVRNSKINGRWGKEETTASIPFKLKRGERFAIQILVTEDKYLVSVNGLHFTNYTHRIPYNSVTCVQVKGDITDAKVEHFPIMVKTLYYYSHSWFVCAWHHYSFDLIEICIIYSFNYRSIQIVLNKLIFSIILTWSIHLIKMCWMLIQSL